MTANMAGAPSAYCRLWLRSTCNSLICAGGHNHLVPAQVSLLIPRQQLALRAACSCSAAPLPLCTAVGDLPWLEARRGGHRVW